MVADGTIQPYEENPSKEDIHNFPVHCDGREKGMCGEPTTTPSITNSSSLDYKQNPYLIAIIAAYVSTYVCGISTKHMEFNDQDAQYRTSMVRYNLYYQMNRFLTYPSKLERYVSSVPDSVEKDTCPPTTCGPKRITKGARTLLTWSKRAKRDRGHNLGIIVTLKTQKDSSPGITYEKNHRSVS